MPEGSVAVRRALTAALSPGSSTQRNIIMKLYAIWLLVGDDWLRESASSDGLVVFTTKQAACYRAADEYGFKTYSAAKRAGWVEVKPLN
jgi:hypothetical protein